MKNFFQKFAAVIGKKVSSCGERLMLNLPLRMRIGKFGILLVKVGRNLQVRYANWNSEFRLKVEFPNDDPDCCIIHVSERIINDPVRSFTGINSQLDKQTQMVRELLDLRGIAQLALHPYNIFVEKGKVFDWKEILPEAEEIILNHLTTKVG